jgi:protocatechuate 3,4-dioxygenase beta subunit
VLNVRGKPIAGAWLDFWQCDGAAYYDVEAYRLCGHQWTDEEGRFRLETVVPSEYDDNLTNADGETRRVYRTAHIHVKVKAPRRGTLTTQLYFPGQSGNSRDGYYGDDCKVEVVETPSGKEGRFNFILR